MADIVVKSSVTDIMSAIQPDSSLDQLCSFLIECEKAQHRYQWASGLLLLTLMGNPEAPKKAADFVVWLAQQTGLHLTQNEIKRRITVYRFYSVFADTRIVELIQDGGVRIAYHAIKSIDHSAPEQARAILEACMKDPHAIDATLQRFRKLRKSPHDIIKVRRSVLRDLREKISESPQHVNGRDWVPLSMVLELLDTLG
jgi:hypothetical protein